MESDTRDDNTAPIHQAPPLTQSIVVPQWQRDLATSGVGRYSCASSIISTRTRLTHQSDDARSIEFEAGGQSFRISRDGGLVTNVTAPPPYPGPPLDNLTEESDYEDQEMLPRNSAETIRGSTNETEVESEHDASVHSSAMRTPLAVGLSERETSPTAIRRQGVLELPQRLKSVFGLRWYASTPATAEAQDIMSSRNSNALRRTRSESSSLAAHRTAQQLSDETSIEPDSLDPTTPGPNPEHQPQNAPWPATKPSPSDNSIDEQTAEISRHYTRMMRDMDREHRKRLHERDTLLARLRELLNEKDIIYRQQLRERDHTIDSLHEQARHRNRVINDLKTRSYEMEGDVQRGIEKARNEVEDVWEKRWKEYEVLLVERLGEGGKSADTRLGEGKKTVDDQRVDLDQGKMRRAAERAAMQDFEEYAQRQRETVESGRAWRI